MKLREALEIVQKELVAAESKVVELKHQLGVMQYLVEKYEPGGVFPNNIPEKKPEKKTLSKFSPPGWCRSGQSKKESDD